jgi:hypothetical protein
MGIGKIVLEIDTKLGPGGLSSIKAGVDMVAALASQVSDAVAELDKFKTVLKNVDMGMVNYADSAAQGLVDTLGLMEGLNRLNQAGARPTQEQFKILTVRAVELAKATGQDATEAFKKLTTGIAKGSSRALTEYGIRLKESTNLAKTQNDALKQLTEGYEDLTTEIETGTERMYSLQNAWGTSMGLIWDSMTRNDTFLGDAVQSITDNLNELNTSLTNLDDGTRSYLFSVQGILDNMLLGWTAMIGKVRELAELLGMESVAAGLGFMASKTQQSIEQRRSEAGIVEYGPFQEKSTPGAGRSGRRGGGSKGMEVEPMIGVSPAAQRWADTLGIPLTAETMGWYEDFAKRMGGVGMGLEGPATERRSGHGFGESDWAGASASVDEKMAELINLEERRAHVQQGAVESLQEYMALRDEELLSMQEMQLYQEHRLTLLSDEEYQESRLVEMRQNEQIYEAEREIHMAYEREQALDFAHQFAVTWQRSYRTVAAGATAVGHMQDLLKASWGSLVTSVIKGTGSWKAALREVLIAKGISIAIEEGWLALQDYFAAASAFARRQYAKGIQLLASGASHTALAAIAGAASGVASRIGGAGGNIASSGAASSYSATPTFGSSGGYGDREQQEVKINIYMDDSASFFGAVVEQNNSARRSGSTSFKTDEAA